MFTKTAKYYDAVYAYKDYEAESKLIASLVNERVPNAKTLLDVACGTGKHLEHLSKQFESTGVDLDAEMLTVARQRVSGVPLHNGDMGEFNLDTGFDAVTCLFSSIAYMKTVERLNQAVANMAAHVNQGGLLMIEQWLTPQTWLSGKVHADKYETDDGFVLRMAVSEPVERGQLVLEYMIGDSSGISKVTETHEMGWFTHDEYINAFEKASLQVEHLEESLTGRGIYIGTKT
ncbi:MAG: class I SAM-dependent methyltransferase [Chloroflexi bacterium]|nr:class I SAM-dependent methyltransferase [Chloroflexota bacterium]